MRKIVILKSILIKKYLKENKSTSQIATELKCSRPTIVKRLREYNIKKPKFLIKKWFEGKNNPNYGNHKLRGCKRPDVSKNLKGRKRPDISKAKKGKHKGNKNSNYIDGRTLKTYYCKDCSKKLSRYDAKRCRKCNYKYLSGENSPTYGKIYHGKWGKYKGIFMRSSWEIKFAQFLDLSGIKYLYEFKTFNLGNTTYTPDFYIPKWDCYIEIKGYWRDDAKYKFKKFRKKYRKINIKIFDYNILNNIGLSIND
ncbi:MAG: hypothetical protein ACTSQG_02800 [Promethearchaeota archaeon]